jgi:hypothetical protein
MVSRLVLGLLIVGLAACSSPAVKQEDMPPSSSARPPVAAPQNEPGGGAVVGLLAEARAAINLQNYDFAAGKLQRAQRVAPRDARVYLEYARLYQHQGEDDLAMSMAERGMLYCEANTCVQLKEVLHSVR